MSGSLINPSNHEEKCWISNVWVGHFSLAIRPFLLLSFLFLLLFFLFFFIFFFLFFSLIPLS